MKFNPIALMIVLPLLASCNTTSIKIVYVRVPVKFYSHDQQQAVAKEIIGGKCPMSTEWLKDFYVARKQAAAMPENK